MKDNGKTTLSLYLPNLEKSQLDLQQKDEGLLVKAGAYHRVLILPDSLMSREITSAGYKDGRLTIVFA